MGDSELYSLIDLYDSEILKIEKVVEVLNRKIGQMHNLESFRTEIMDRFNEIGLVVHVTVYTDNGEPEIFSYVIRIDGRTEAIQWDPDRQVHEVRTDILDLLPNEEKGQWIKTKLPEDSQKPDHS
jgi:hypothetical protein